ncbi:glycerol-3-phosphate dehydrogenase/oxidase [Sciscionella sediminilitoris]|uniref:glycerol-3-phosphate dehydrogenase/oxidase n=1 Tax=Sciscionella sediminilitoris TaxID=1445613 RepID=UPI0004DEDB23|nr:glycerol-3-phosphate dehydrogenase/oxidase [Sciscionella sp. SE31]
MNPDLNADRRNAELAALEADPRVDVLVIGGGVTGTGIALDAASRGLSVVLAERADLANGTSRWSSKLVHGGLRYLASGGVGIAYESAVERGILLERTAPHLVHPLPQLIPLLPGVSKGESALVRAGYLAGDVLRTAARTAPATLPRSRRVRPSLVRRLAPTVRGEGLRGGLVFWDGQLTDDARLVTALARTAAAHGARVLTRCAADAVTGNGAVLRDTVGGRGVEVRARAVINAAGVWAGELAEGVQLRPSRGTHLVFPASEFGGLTAGLTIPVPGERNRFVFALPAPDGRVYVGLTDEEADGPVPDVPEASAAEIDFLLDTVNSALTEPLERGRLLGTYSGLRPLLDTGGGRTADVSRKHSVLHGSDGLITIVGGKLTTYRRMAQDAVDAAVGSRNLAAGPCRTKRLPLVGATPRARLASVPAPARLVRAYGTEASRVLAEADGDPELLAPIADGTTVTGAELRFAIRSEGALVPEDVLDRRTRIGLDPELRARVLPLVARYFGG